MGGLAAPPANGLAGFGDYGPGTGGSEGCPGIPGNSVGEPGTGAPLGAGGGANQFGGNGACRIVWGDGTSWPSNVPPVTSCLT
jgi:hypothetical protein